VDRVVVYLTKQGATVHCGTNRLVVRKGRQVLRELPIETVGQVVVCGSVQLTAQVMRLLMQRGIDVAFVSTRGEFYGRLDPMTSGSPQLRRAQYTRSQDDEFRVTVARGFVRSKLHNQRVLLARRKGKSEDLAEVCVRLKALEARVDRHDKLESLRGVEGSAAGAYFKGFRASLKNAMGFTKRARRPPPDPVNILLSLGYTLLFKDMVAAIHQVGLDAYQGFFHDIRSGHAALASDLIEEFRPVLVDSLVMSVINRSEITPDGFCQSDEGRCEIKSDPLRCFLRQYSKRINSEVIHPHTGERTSYLRCLALQARLLAQVLLEKRERYQGFTMR